MNKLKIHFENCFGIKKITHEFIFNESNKVNAIYAKNGLMKTSFTKVFKKIQDGKNAEIIDEIFKCEPVVKNIEVNDKEVNPKEIFVIRSFEREYESASISSLLVNDEMKAKLSEVLGLRDKLIKNLEKKSGLKDLIERTLFADFDFNKNSFFDFLNEINVLHQECLNVDLKYSDIFESNLETILSDEFQNNIESFLNKSNEIFDEYKFLDKGKFSFPKLVKIEKELKSSSFFVNENSINLNNKFIFNSTEVFGKKVKEIEKKLTDSNEMKAIQKSLSTAKGTILRDLLESNPSLVNEFKKTNLPSSKRKVWCSYFIENQYLIIEIKNKFASLKSEISNINIDNTPWKEAIDIFNDRFTLPFKMDIENLDSCVIGESLPKVVFKFCAKENEVDCSESDWVSLNRNELESKNTLSQGENRALYLLNIVFDIEKRKKEKQKTLFIIDDIADSFDYKNKYAIIEYLNDIINVEEKNFYMIVLSHNFDFYRTLSSRLNIDREFKYNAIKKDDEIKLIEEHYQDNPFVTWKKNLTSGRDYTIIDCKKHLISLIPFIRNIIDFGEDKKVIDGLSDDYLFLTNLLHQKKETQTIDIKSLKKVFKAYINKNNFDSSISDDIKVYDIIIDIVENHISTEDIKLENKIILAIAIRLKAESYIMNEIKNSIHTFSWKKKKNEYSDTGIEFLNHVEKEKNQTRKLFEGFIQIGTKEEIKLLESVNIMTPENIHLNSFMYEPILDMDITELMNLYQKVRSLVNN